MDKKAQISLVMVPLVIMSIAVGAAMSLSNGNVPVAHEELPTPLDNRSVVFLGASPGSNPILDEVRKATMNITCSDDISMLSTVETNASMVLIDGDWARKADQGQLVNTVRSLILAGTPIVVINGDPGIIKEAIGEDHRIGFMTATPSNSLSSAGIHYDAENQCSQGYAYSSIDWDLGMAGMNAYEWCAQFLGR